MNEDIKREIEIIKKYQKNRELEKLWEISLTRKISYFILTYSSVSLFFIIIGIDRPLVRAIIPSVVYYLFLVSIDLVKKWWIESHK
ncbi:MAG: hypothetical protein KatS3mg089_0491 [Patescibacteria group bacterium]|nr:MAG: hypothetical protein KatS3mg089_0491 [Patescibacteria group bacterium]